MKKYKDFVCVGFALALSTVICAAKNDAKIHVSQLGYTPNSDKKAMVVPDGKVDSFYLCDAASGKICYRGKLSPKKYWDLSGEDLQWADFSSYDKSGEYYLSVGGKKSYNFTISSKAYDDLTLWAHKTFYLWRCGIDCTEEFSNFHGQSYAHKAGHPDVNVIVHPSAESAGRKAGSTVKSPGGWYDAGDYGKYTINSAIALESMLMGAEVYSKFYKNFDMEIPESTNNTPDVLDEAMYNLKWMLTMIDTVDGCVAHKVTTKRFVSLVLPAETNEQRYMIGKSTATNYSFAAIMAKASRLFKNNPDYPDFSAKAMRYAKQAYEWAEKNPGIIFHNPDSIYTGSYCARYPEQFRFWADVELYLATKDKKYIDLTAIDTFQYDVPTWQLPASLALMSLITGVDNGTVKGALKKKTELHFSKLATLLYDRMEKSAGCFPLHKFEWGSNGSMSNAGSILLLQYRHTGDRKYLKAAQDITTYLIGRNATGYCFVTGYGKKSPMFIHDRRSTGDGIAVPVPGLIAGGPTLDAITDCDTYVYKYDHPKSEYPTREYSARAYNDEICSYSTNEVAINWSAPFAMLLAGINEAMMNAK